MGPQLGLSLLLFHFSVCSRCHSVEGFSYENVMSGIRPAPISLWAVGVEQSKHLTVRPCCHVSLISACNVFSFQVENSVVADHVLSGQDGICYGVSDRFALLIYTALFHHLIWWRK